MSTPAIRSVKDLISAPYRRQNAVLHSSPEGFGGSGWRHAQNVIEYAEELRARTLLDYGAGQCTLRRQLRKLGSLVKIAEYDPAVKHLSSMPRPADLVVCTDVLEHVEPRFLRNVIWHLYSLSRRGCYLVVATRPANKILPDGRNAHLIIRDTVWWRDQIEDLPWEMIRIDDRRKENGDGYEVRMWLRRR